MEKYKSNSFSSKLEEKAEQSALREIDKKSYRVIKAQDIVVVL